MKKKISVVIPTYNEEGNVKRQPFQGQNADVSAGTVRKE